MANFNTNMRQMTKTAQQKIGWRLYQQFKHVSLSSKCSWFLVLSA